MNSLKHKIKALSIGLLSASLPYFPITAHSTGAGTLADEPLFITPGAKPNVLFMVDDSGSMDFELATPDPTPSSVGAAGAEEIRAGGNTWIYFHLFNARDNAFNDDRITPSWNAANAIELAGSTPDSPLTLTSANEAYEGIWRARNSNYNQLYYDPSVTYEPWTGVDEAGNTYQNANPTAALFDPFDANSSKVGGNTYNLTENDSFDTRRVDTGDNDWNVTLYPMTYWSWNDLNSDAVVDPNERGTQVQIISTDNTYDRAPTRRDCANDTCTYLEESRNFANWWQYHRRREYSMKSAMVDVINESTGTRMGIATINSNDSANAERPIADIDTGTNKDDLIESLFNVQSVGGTPLNRALRDAGRYYESTGGPFATNTSPIEPIVGMCQQNFTILLTDGAYSDDGSFSTPDNADNNAAGNNSIFDGGPYADDESDTLADIAMYFYERDLSDTFDDDVPTQCGVDQNDAQHMVTYTVSFGLEASFPSPEFPNPSTHIGLPHPVLDIAGQNCTATTVANPVWPSRQGNGRFSPQNSVNELVHAAYNGRGEYFEAENAEQLTASLQQVLNSIRDRSSGTGSGVSFNASTLGTDSRLFLAQFDTERWSGDLLAFNLNADGSVGSQAWSAADALDGPENSPTPALIPWENRRIWTHNGSVAGSAGGIDFEFGALSNEQKNDLRTNAGGTITNENGTAANDPLDDAARERLNFIHGDHANEMRLVNGETVGKYRERDSRLGDIIQSGAVFVGIPSLGWPDAAPFPTAVGERYSDFRLAETTVDRVAATLTDPAVTTVTSNRDEVVYVGANDGMLHGFNANNGAEQLAYIPSYLFSTTPTRGLHYLTDPNYTHRYSHDLTPTISDVYLNGAWKTILIGGHRAGASGFFALDVTNPSTFNTTNPVMWEFRGEVGPDPDNPLGDADLGSTFSKPTIVLTNTVKNGENRWAAVFGNGYNQSPTANDEAQLFVVFLDPDLSDGWTLNDDYIKIRTGSNGGSIAPNGLSTPALVDLNGDSTADRAYAGDLAGDIWAFDLCGTRDANGLCPTTNPNTNWTAAHGLGTPLFNGDSTKPITTQPQIVRNPQVNTDDNNEPNLIVLFGTGRYISVGDNTNIDGQSFYGVWDAGSNSGNINPDIDLVAQTLLFDANASENATTNLPVSYSESAATEGFGWRFDLPITGERSVSNAVVRNGIVFFNSIIPSPNPCDNGGRSFINFLTVENGGRPNQSVFDFVPNGIVDDGDLINGGTTVGSRKENDVGIAAEPSFLGDTLYIAGTETETGADIDTSGVTGLNPLGGGRISWGELLLE